MNFKKTYSGIFTILFFSILVSSFTSVLAVEEDFSTTAPTAKTTTSTKNASPAASSKAAVKGTTTAKPIIYKGEISATPSAVGKFIIRTSNGEKNVDSTKTTKTYSYITGKKTVTSVSKLKVSDNVAVIGTMSEDNKSLVATHILVTPKEPDEVHSAMYGTVSTREASGAAFTLVVKSPSKDEEKTFVLNNNSGVKVKDLDNPKLSDIKIGDRVTLTYETVKDVNYITKIYAIPGRAAGLLRDIRESSAAASTKPSTTPASSSAALGSKATSTPKATTKTTATPKTTTKPTATP